MPKRSALPIMLAAARLTRSGRVQEATALLQRALHGTAPANEPSANAADLDVDVIDVPSRETASAAEEEPTPASARRVFRMEALDDVLQRFGAAPGGAPAARGPVDHGPGQFIAGEFVNGAGRRAYKLYIPSRRDDHAGAPMPLIVMLHGCTQSPDDFAAGTRMNLIAEKKGCLVLYPAQAQGANASGCWNWFKREEQQRGRGEPSILAGMTRDVMARHAVDPARVYAVGLSAGGAMAAVLAVTYPELYAAVGIHSGLACGAAQDLPSALTAMNGMPAMADDGGSGPRSAVPTIVFHGDRDRTVHPRNGEQLVRESDAHDPASGPTTRERGQAPGGHGYTRTVHRDGRGIAVLEHWEVHGGGHAWFGGSTAGSYCDPRGPDASEEISRFLLDHRH